MTSWNQTGKICHSSC